jgi:hypothetical protein
MASDPVQFAIDNWESLGVAEHGGILHMPATIKRRNAKGGIDEEHVMLRNVTHQQRFTCRSGARRYAERAKLDVDRDRELVTEIENYSILTYAIRDAKPPFDQHVAELDQLLARYDTQSLVELWGKYNVWVEMLDPRYGELDSDQVWQVIARVAREANPSPLVALAGREQLSCIVIMARLALSSPTRPSWLDSPETFKVAS